MEDDDGPPELGYVEVVPLWLTKSLAQSTYKKEKEDEDFETFDANGDGLLDFDEIVTYFNGEGFINLITWPGCSVIGIKIGKIDI